MKGKGSCGRHIAVLGVRFEARINTSNQLTHGWTLCITLAQTPTRLVNSIQISRKPDDTDGRYGLTAIKTITGLCIQGSDPHEHRLR